jgi:lipopolysaccharide export LptBFGC system permease protein LptF
MQGSFNGYERDGNNKLWIGSSKGVYVYDHLTGEYEVYNSRNSSLSVNSVFSLKADSKGRMWLGTGGAVFMYDRAAGVFKSDVFPEHVLPYTKSVRFIYEDKKKNLWFCDDKEGVVKVDESFTTFEHITIDDFLPNNSVMSIVEDPKNGGLWFATQRGYNIYVKQKDRETGMLKDVLIYNFSDGFENAHIIWASEGKMEMTADKQHLYLHLYNGEQFENLKSQTISSNNVPYRRETFREKHTIIEFDGGFNMVDGSFLSDRSDSKNMIEISQSIDSLNHRADSLGRSMYNEIKASTYRNIVLSKTDSAKIVETNNKINVDSLFNSYTLAEKDKTLGSAADRTEALASEWSMKSYQTTDADNNIRKHEADWHKKITLSLSCLIFFFIGAPLGAIIRKGGLGMPVVVSVLIFVIYYIIDSGATRVAKSGEMNMVLGVWMSTIVLAPIGAFFTYKSNNDSVVFNAEVYINFFRMLLGLRPSRHVFKKEVIIEDPDYPRIQTELEKLCNICNEYAINEKTELTDKEELRLL